MRFGFIGFGQILSFCSFLLIFLHIIEFGSVLRAGQNVKNKVCRKITNTTWINFNLFQWTELMNNLLLAKINSNEETCNAKISDIVTTMSMKRIEFSASNFFPIDLTIVTGVSLLFYYRPYCGFYFSINQYMTSYLMFFPATCFNLLNF